MRGGVPRVVSGVSTGVVTEEVSDKMNGFRLVKASWLLAWGILFSLFISYSFHPSEDLSFAVRSSLFTGMLTLSLPSGLLFLELASLFLSDYVCPGCDLFFETCLSAGLFVSGCLQWLIILKCFDARRVITLQLSDGHARAPHRSAPQSSHPPQLRPPRNGYEPPFLYHD